MRLLTPILLAFLSFAPCVIASDCPRAVGQRMYFVETMINGESVEVPIIDITNPVFIPKRSQDSRTHSIKSIPGLIGLNLIAVAPKSVREKLIGQSLIFRDFLGDATYLDSDATYQMKLGDLAHLPWDQTIARSKQSTATMYRLESMAKFYARMIREQMSVNKPSKIVFVNIGGGTGIDSLNGIFEYLKENNLDIPIEILLFEKSPIGPNFLKKAVSKLQFPNAPLSNLNIQVTHIGHEWSSTSSLELALDAIDRNALVLGGSEGALFEYADDDTIIAHLKAFFKLAPANSYFVGSAFWDRKNISPVFHLSQSAVNMRWRLRGLQGAEVDLGVDELARFSNAQIRYENPNNAFWPTFVLERFDGSRP